MEYLYCPGYRFRKIPAFDNRLHLMLKPNTNLSADKRVIHGKTVRRYA